MMDILLPLFQLLYFIAHFLISLLQAFYETYQDLVNIFFMIINTGKNNPSDQKLFSHAKSLKKKPNHLAFLLMQNNVTMIDQLSKAVNWGLKYQVKYISIYDVQGVMKQKWDDLHQRITVLYPEIKILQGPSNKLADTSSPTAVLNLLSIEDGRNDLAEIIKKSEEPINPELVQNLLKTCHQPDPDLVIIAGQPLITMGFLPWQIKFSEFYSITSLKRLNYNMFRDIMCKYSNCEQRLGK